MSAPLIAVQRTVEFAETDAAGLLHFSNYLRYVESAERELFEQWGVPLLAESAGQLGGFPRVRIQCDYSAPLKFGDRVEVSLILGGWSARSVIWRFRFERVTPGPRERVAKGSMTTVHAILDRSTGRIESASLPVALRNALEAVPRSSDTSK